MKVTLFDIAVIALLAGLYWGGYRHGISVESARAGVEISSIKTNYDRQVLQSHLAAEKAQADARRTEQEAAARQAQVDEDHRKELQREKDAADRTIAGLRAGSIRLSYKSARVGLQPGATGGAVAETPRAACGTDGRSETDLPPAIAADLFGIAADADALAINYGRLQEVVRGYQRIYGPAENKTDSDDRAAVNSGSDSTE
ncbi:lysis system i-spanin subunit Rz [Uliginosibacterium sediminicola]|uniref:Lysis system i-spanin subunit Rz n=1 Tax=Uliginosibacterium sediminicola TaxID=2024550 RepID=A0ABU9YWK7_9RHOO